MRIMNLRGFHTSQSFTFNRVKCEAPEIGFPKVLAESRLFTSHVRLLKCEAHKSLSANDLLFTSHFTLLHILLCEVLNPWRRGTYLLHTKSPCEACKLFSANASHFTFGVYINIYVLAHVKCLTTIYEILRFACQILTSEVLRISGFCGEAEILGRNPEIF